MRAIVQRVSNASVTVDSETIAQVDEGLLIFVCAMSGDSEEEARLLARKLANLRIFKDENGKMNRSVLDINGTALAVSQFTLAADTSRGNRPGFSRASDPEEGEQLYEKFCLFLKQQGVPVRVGRFGADMQIALINEGPVTIWLDTVDWGKGRTTSLE